MSATYLRTPAVALAIGILVGTVVQLAMQIPALVERGMKFSGVVSVERSRACGSSGG